MTKIKRISIREYGIVLKPLNLEKVIADTVQREDEVEHARTYVPVEIPKLNYPSVDFKPTSLHAFIVGFMP